MSEFSSANDYIKRLQRLIEFDATFSFAKFRIVKSARIDDLMACILAAFPDSYKKALQKKNNSLYSSVIAYHTLKRVLKQKFFLFPDYYIVDEIEAKRAIEAIILSLDNDILNIEEHDA